MFSCFFVLGAITALPASTAAAQPIPRDSLAIEQQRVIAELARGFYWPDRRAETGVQECQLRLHGICLAEHLTVYSAQPVLLAGGYPRVFENAPPKAPGSFVMIPDRLQELADSSPDNGWALGQLAYIYSYNSTKARALSAVAPPRCRGSEWWCTALRAFVNHSYEDFRAADSLFASALASMPESERCKWRDISSLLDVAARTSYDALTCQARVDFENRFWWLSDPLYSIAGNERRTEHFSRRVIDSLVRNFPSPFNRRDTTHLWGESLSEILMRYGMASHWIVPGKIAGVVKWIHLHIPSYQFTPRGVSYTTSALPLIGAESYRFAIPLDSARERYHPDYDYVVDLTQSQTVALPRGDSMIVAAAVDMSREAVAEAAPFNASLILARHERDRAVTHSRSNVSAQARFTTIVPNAATLVGIEALSANLRVAARNRFTLEPPTRTGGKWITQPLLLSQFETAPRRAADAIPLMLASEEIRPGQALGIYWEVGGAPVGASAKFNLRALLIEPRRPGILATISGLFRTVIVSDTLEVEWTERLADGGVSGHALNLNLSSLRQGSYRLELEVEFADGVRATSFRSLDIVAPNNNRRPLIEVLRQPVARLGTGATREDPPTVRRR